MEEEKSILDSVYKECVCCGKKFTLRNYRLLEKSDFGDGLVSIADKFSNVCKCCEKKPEMQLKSNRLANLREKMARFKENEKKRISKERQKELDEESGMTIYKK